ncbi:MAG: hypothetical protein GY931_13520 [Maribacter sp.]|nr:hypothetical protein [Maribacter sp.]
METDFVVRSGHTTDYFPHQIDTQWCTAQTFQKPIAQVFLAKFLKFRSVQFIGILFSLGQRFIKSFGSQDGGVIKHMGNYQSGSHLFRHFIGNFNAGTKFLE